MQQSSNCISGSNGEAFPAPGWQVGRGLAVVEPDVTSLTAVTHLFAQDMKN